MRDLVKTSKVNAFDAKENVQITIKVQHFYTNKEWEVFGFLQADVPYKKPILIKINAPEMCILKTTKSTLSRASLSAS